MRRWLAVLAGVAAIAVAGTALALTGPEVVAGEEPTTETTVKVEATTTTVEATTTTVEEPVEGDEAEKDEVVWEEPDRYVPFEPGDHLPPTIEILQPEDGQVFERREVAFEGVAEPGSDVFVGDYPADVGEDGSWRIVLHLDDGENHITAWAVDESGNRESDSVTVIYEAPKKEEPKKEEPKKEEPKEEPKEEEPKEEQPKEVEWAFSAHQTYGECSESPPYDVFYGTGKPGSTIVIESEFGRKTAEVGEHGEWEVKVVFEGAPVGEAFQVHVVDKYDHHKVFEFVHTD